MGPTREGVVESCKLMLDEQRPERRSERARFAGSPYPKILSMNYCSIKKLTSRTHQLGIKLGQSWLPIIVEDKHSVDHDEQQKSNCSSRDADPISQELVEFPVLLRLERIPQPLSFNREPGSAEE